jgi:branched-chain amino acid transport system substrate-binding protein
MNRRPRTVRTLVLASLACLALPACSARVGDDGGGTDAADASAGSASTADCEGYDPAPGVTDDTISIGASLPVTGPLAAAGTERFGWQAYFDHVNANGGVDGRQLEFTVLDDGYDPAKTAQNVRQLTTQDNVFALAGVLGTAPVLSYLDDTQAACIPNLMVATGAPVFAQEKYDWTVAALPTYSAEAAVLADYATSSGITSVALLAQNDDFGKSYTDAFTAELEGSGIEVVDTETFEVSDPTVDAQVSKLASSGADAVLVAALGTKCVQIMNGIQAADWQPEILAGALCTTRSLLDTMDAEAKQDMVSTQWYKNPSDPQWADDEAMTTYREALAEYAPEADPNEDFVLNAWISAQVFVQLLEDAPELTRAGLMGAARNADVHVDTMLDGIDFTTGADDYAPIESMQPTRFDPAAGIFRAIDPATGEFLAAGQTSVVSFEGTSVPR